MVKEMAMLSRQKLLKPLNKCGKARKSHHSVLAAALLSRRQSPPKWAHTFNVRGNRGLQFRDFEPKAVFCRQPTRVEGPWV
jgi:hypothetical protein